GHRDQRPRITLLDLLDGADLDAGDVDVTPRGEGVRRRDLRLEDQLRLEEADIGESHSKEEEHHRGGDDPDKRWFYSGSPSHCSKYSSSAVSARLMSPPEM